MIRIAALLLFACALPASAAGVYKCTSADGKTVYSETPCPKDASAEKLRVPRSSSDADAGNTDDKTAGNSLDAQIAAATDPVMKAQLELQKKQCELARTQLQRYESAPYLVEQQADGTQRRLSEEETAAEKARLKNLLAEKCQ